jgi:hypothetical protein
MNKNILVPLTKEQITKIKKKFGIDCDHIEVDANKLPNIVKYISPKICIDFDDKQEALIQKAFPDKECDFAVITRGDFTPVTKYLSPRGVKPK